MKPTKLFLTCEHAVDTVPGSYKHLFNQQEAVLKTHRAIDFGALDLTVHLSKALNCAYTQATVTRLLIDCNRSLKHPTCFSEFTQLLSADEKNVLIKEYYQPYRNHAETIIQNYIEQGNQVLHISCHSFTPVFKGVTRNAGISFLYDPKHHGEKEVARLWHGLLDQETKYRTRMNYPYKGTSDGFTSCLRKQLSEHDYLGLELEVNQALLMQDKESVETLKNALSNSLIDLMLLL